MRRITVNVILIEGFILLMTAIALSFAAEMEFAQAKKLEAGYRWSKAGEKYQAAMCLNPFKAEYFTGAGDFMVRQSAYREEKTSWFKRAKRLYERAAYLNPYYAESWYLLGKVQIEMYRNRGEMDRNKLEEIIENFKKAIELDRYNFRNNYLIGHNLLLVWGFLYDAEKSFAKRRLKYVLQLRPDYGGKYLYPAIMYYTKDFSIAQEVMPEDLRGCKNLLSFIKKNNLWQYRKEQKKLIDLYMQKGSQMSLSRKKK